MRAIYDFLLKIPFFSKFVISGLSYLAIVVLYSNFTWHEFRNKIPFLSKVFYSKNLSVVYQLEKRKKEKSEDSEEQNGSITVDLIEAESAITYPKIESSAVLEPVIKSDIFSKVSGRIEKLYVTEGEFVKKGKKLVKLDSMALELELMKLNATIESVRSQVRLAKEKYKIAQRSIEMKFNEIDKRKLALEKANAELERINEIIRKKKILLENQSITKEEYENLLLEVKSREVAVENSRKDYEILLVGFRDSDIIDSGNKVPESEQDRMKLFKTLNTKVEYSELEVAEKNLEVAEVNKKTTEMLINESTLFSPINGVVSKINRYEGELINSGSSGNSPILTVMDTSNLFVTISINEKDLSKFKRGQENKILVDSLPDNVYFGKIVRISPSVDPRTHTTEIKIEIKNKNQELRPGMFVRAETVLGEKVESLLVPIEAVLLNSEKTGFAFIAKGTNIFKTEIKIKEKIGDKYSIESGVVPNDFVAVTNLGRLVDGSPIIPRIKK